MNNFSYNLNLLHTSIQETGVKDLTVKKTGHQVMFEGYTESNIKVLIKINEAMVMAQTSPAAWSYCADPNNDMWIQRVSFLQNIPGVIQDIIDNRRFDNSYLKTLVENKEDEKEDDKDTDKKDGHKYEYGCLMAIADLEDWDTDFINDDDLYFDDDEPADQYGKEDEPHVTLLFGFHQDEIDMKDIQKFIDDNVTAIEDIKLTGISCFNNDKYDVLKYDVESETLNKLNKKLRDEFPYTNDYPDYHPHMTLAYLKPGKGKQYEEKFEEPKDLGVIHKLKYSSPDGDKKFYTLKEDEAK